MRTFTDKYTPLVCQHRWMANGALSAHAVHRAGPGLGVENATILRLQGAARHVQANHGKTATRKPVQVGHFVSKLSLFLSLLACLIEGDAIGLLKLLIVKLVGFLFAHWLDR